MRSVLASSVEDAATTTGISGSFADISLWPFFLIFLLLLVVAFFFSLSR